MASTPGDSKLPLTGSPERGRAPPLASRSFNQDFGDRVACDMTLLQMSDGLSRGGPEPLYLLSSEKTPSQSSGGGWAMSASQRAV
jgi:hypothetical protein